MALVTWRRITRPKQKFAGGAAKRGTLRDPAQGNRIAASTPLEKISPETTTCRRQCVMQFFGRQPRRESIRVAAKEAKQAVNKGTEARRGAPMERYPGVLS